MSSRTLFRVRFGDIDPAGIVFYPVLVRYTHAAVEDFLEARGVDYPALLEDGGIGLPTVHLEMSFLGPLRYGDRVQVHTRVEKLGRTSVHWHHELFRESGGRVEPEPCAVARIVTVCVRLDGMAKCTVPEWLREHLRADAPEAG